MSSDDYRITSLMLSTSYYWLAEINVVISAGAMMELDVSPTTLTFDGSNNLQYVRVSSPADTVLEYDGLFALTLTNPVPSSRITLYPDSVNVTILDNAGMLCYVLVWFWVNTW